MKVKELRKLMADLPEDTEVFIPGHAPRVRECFAFVGYANRHSNGAVCLGVTDSRPTFKVLIISEGQD